MHTIWKWISTLVIVLALGAAWYWFSLDKHIRYLALNPPANENVLFWTTAQRDAGFRVIDKLDILPKRTIKKGPVIPFAQGPTLPLDENQLASKLATGRVAGLVALYRGDIVLERYGLDFTRQEKWTSFSVAKSFTSTLVGAAIKDGFINSIDDKVSDYIPDMKGSVYDDVTIEQLLTMTSGVRWNENYADPNSDVAQFNFHQPDPNVDVTASYMRQLARDVPPGTRWLYSTGETNLIGLLVSQATGVSLSEYLSQKVWSKIGAEQDASWVLGPTNHEISGCCIQASTRDYARFGQFILNGAIVEGRSIVPDDWFANATTKQADIGQSGRGYGYQWWTFDDGTFHGRGIFGQGLFIDRERELVIAINSNWEKASGAQLTASKEAIYHIVQQAVDALNSPSQEDK